MKTIGLIGGMSWESSALYYQILNRKTQGILGGGHSCKCILHSVDFHEIAALQHEHNWKMLAVHMVQAARKLEKAGAELIALCSNTMHKVATDIERSASVPFLHIVDATAECIQKKSINRVGLIGTRFTMEEPFLVRRYADNFGMEVITPHEEERENIHRIIYEELVRGQINYDSKNELVSIMNGLLDEGAEGIILGCTEIELLIKAQDVDAPLFPTTQIHAEKLVEEALKET